MSKKEQTLNMKFDDSVNHDTNVARVVLNTGVLNGITVQAYAPCGIDANLGTLVKQLSEQCTADNFSAEKMLMAQAHTLDTMFNSLASRAAHKISLNDITLADTLLKLALRAQNQCGKTLQVILQNQQNKLLSEVQPNDSMDYSQTAQAIEGNKTMATLAVIDGGKVRSRQKESVAECV